MISRVSLLAILLAVAGFAVSATPAARTPPAGTAIFLVQQDPRLCPSPRCGGHWAALANGVRTRCADGVRRVRCYVATTVDRHGRRLGGAIPEGSLARGALEPGLAFAGARLDRLRLWALYSPAGTAAVAGGYYRVRDNGIRCVRAPCFSYRATGVNSSMFVMASAVDLTASGGSPSDQSRARAALRTKDGLYARGTFARSPDGGRVFRAVRLYLRAPLPRA
ncbi:MAG TPA: DUF6748 domain-containing protein [Gaiellaceae bacterium]|nr:DUF6748 domain-containing protein [Gaiellaceae bacterium]